MTRHELRYKAMTILYQAFLYGNNNIEYSVDSIIDEQLGEVNEFVSKIVNGVIFNRNEIDEYANKYLEDWDISRLGYTDQAILRMGIYEIVWTDTPDVTCIDEAVELSKEYSDEKVCKMINGVLDKVYHNKDKND